MVPIVIKRTDGRVLMSFDISFTTPIRQLKELIVNEHMLHGIPDEWLHITYQGEVLDDSESIGADVSKLRKNKKRKPLVFQLVIQRALNIKFETRNATSPLKTIQLLVNDNCNIHKLNEFICQLCNVDRSLYALQLRNTYLNPRQPLAALRILEQDILVLAELKWKTTMSISRLRHKIHQFLMPEKGQYPKAPHVILDGSAGSKPAIPELRIYKSDDWGKN